MDIVKSLSILVILAFITGCVSNQDLPLIFGQSQTVGISIGAGAADQGADFVLGYKDKNVAIVPVTAKDLDGSSVQVASKSGEEFEDALSVLGQFEVKTDTAQGNVGLEKFFATGAAAKSLSDGFSCKLAGGNAKDCGFADLAQDDGDE
jgi:hypothetical protein